MSLLDKIEEIQSKPENYRKKILAVSLIITMTAISFVWITTFNFSSPKKGGEKASVIEPFQAVLNTARSTIYELKDFILGESKDAILYERREF